MNEKILLTITRPLFLCGERIEAGHTLSLSAFDAAMLVASGKAALNDAADAARLSAAVTADAMRLTEATPAAVAPGAALGQIADTRPGIAVVMRDPTQPATYGQCMTFSPSYAQELFDLGLARFDKPRGIGFILQATDN